tara:strand:+ start:322 stop:540 length:219 start_codon:yes stop_codon:yes gene_type:complete
MQEEDDRRKQWVMDALHHDFHGVVEEKMKNNTDEERNAVMQSITAQLKDIVGKEKATGVATPTKKLKNIFGP